MSLLYPNSTYIMCHTKAYLNTMSYHTKDNTSHKDTVEFIVYTKALFLTMSYFAVDTMSLLSTNIPLKLGWWPMASLPSP